MAGIRNGSTRALLEWHFLDELEQREEERVDGWIYSDEYDPEVLRDIATDRCSVCGELREMGLRVDPVFGVKELHDPCIAGLPGVLQACCGHGRYGRSVYVCGAGFGELRGPAAARKMRELGGNPPSQAFLLDPVLGARS